MIQLFDDSELSALFYKEGDFIYSINENKISGAVSGSVLEFIISWSDFYLVLLTGETLFENTLYIYLLDNDLKEIDFARVDSIYSTDILSSVSVDIPNYVYFNFMGSWVLEIFKKPCYSLCRPSIIKHKYFIKSWFKIGKFSGS